jgi:hypothetical protein
VPLSIQNYLIDQTGIDWQKALSSWSWLVPPEFTLWLVNRIADLFLVFPDGSVHMLDVGAGTLTKVAKNRDSRFGSTKRTTPTIGWRSRSWISWWRLESIFNRDSAMDSRSSRYSVGTTRSKTSPRYRFGTISGRTDQSTSNFEIYQTERKLC